MKQLCSTSEEKKITDNLIHRQSISLDENCIYLDIEYLKGKFTIQKVFPNNYMGLDQLEQTIKDFNTEEKVKKYFKL